MWFVHLNEKDQTIHIDSNQREIMSISLPHTYVPSPGREVLMSKAANTQMWDDLHELVQAANKGK